MLAALLLACPLPQLEGPSPDAAMLAELASDGVRLDTVRGIIEIDAELCQRDVPLEYLLIRKPHGQAHESLLATDASALALNTAMILLGAESAEEAVYQDKDPPITEEQYREGIKPYLYTPPKGFGLFIYVVWTETDLDGIERERCFRAEELVLHTRQDRTVRRGPWVYFGSRFVRPHKDAEEFYAAQAQGNLISICSFSPPNQLMMSADPDGDNQYCWYPNLFLLPELGHPMRILFSKKPLEQPAPALAAQE